MTETNRFGRGRILTLLLATIAIAFLVASPAVLASEPSATTGSFTDSATPTSSSSAGSNTFVTYSNTLSFSGTEAGTCVGAITIVFHADGTFNFAGTCTFKGTVGDSGPGSAEYSFVGTGAGLNFNGNLVATAGAGGLAGLHLVHTFAGILTSLTTTAGTYSGQYHFDP